MMSLVGISAASTTTSSPQLHRYDEIVPSESDDALPSALNVAPTLTEYGPPVRATGAALVVGVGVGVGVGVVDGLLGALISTPLVHDVTTPRSAPGTVPPCPA